MSDHQNGLPTLPRDPDGVAITSRTSNRIIDALQRYMPNPQGSHLGGPFLGQPVMYKLRGWKKPVELAGAWYWASKVQVGKSLLDPTKDVRLVFDWDVEAGDIEGYPDLTYREPNLIIINPSDIVVYTSIEYDDEGNQVDPQPIPGRFYATRSGHSMGIGDEDSGLPTAVAEFNIAYLIGQATVEGKIYDVAMAPRDDRWFVVKIAGKTETIASEEVDLPAELYTAKMIARHGVVSNVAGPKEWAQLGTAALEANCYFRNIETGGSTSSSGPAGHMLLDNVEIPEGHSYEPYAIGYLSDFTYDGIPIIAGYCISSTECTDDEEGSGG